MAKEIKCERCGVCCKLFYINLNQQEYTTGKYKTVFEQFNFDGNFSEAVSCGANLLAKKNDGSCIYLKNNSCTIHSGRPQVCHQFFCKGKEKKFLKMRQMVAKYKKLVCGACFLY